MKACPSCHQQNADDANFCSQCGKPLIEESRSVGQEYVERQADAGPGEQDLWKMLIGPSKSIQFSFSRGWAYRPAFEYYLSVFKKFQASGGPRFAIVWHWPAFLFDPFLWFLYRKMYMYALVYAIGPVASAFLTGDLTVGIVWRIMAGVSANYLYFWHLKDHLQKAQGRFGMDVAAKMRMLGEEGGVQPYVLWLGIALHLFMIGVLIAAFQEGPPKGGNPFRPTMTL